MRLGTIAIFSALLSILAAAIAYAYIGLTVPGDPMPAQWWVALICGVVFSLVVGIGLMALLFYSSRRGYDEPARMKNDERK